MSTYVIPANTRSDPIPAGANSVVRVSGTPNALDYTQGSFADVQNGVAKWTTLALTNGSAIVNEKILVRIITGATSMTVETVSAPTQDDKDLFTQSVGVLNVSSLAALSTRPRVHFFCDSEIALGYSSTVATTAVSDGINAVFTFPGNHNCSVGQYLTLANVGNPTASAHPLSVINVKPISATNSVLTIPASFNGASVPAGDFSSIAGSPWTTYSSTATNDQTLFAAVNSLMRNPFVPVAMTGFTGALPQSIGDVMNKALCSQSPAFDVAWVQLGKNISPVDVGAASLNQVDVAIYENFYHVTKRICLPILNAGYPIILVIPCPNGAGYAGGIGMRNIGFARYRDLLLGFADRYRGQIRPLDHFAAVVDSSGNLPAAYTTDNVHALSGAYLNSARQLLPRLVDLYPAERAPINTAATTGVLTAYAASTAYVLADKVSANGHVYRMMAGSGNSGTSQPPSGTANGQVIGTCVFDYVGPVASTILVNAGMTGTGGTDQGGTLYTGGTNTIPTSWRIDSATNMPGISLSAQPRPQTSDASNSVNWGNVWTLNLAPTAAQLWQAQQPVNLAGLLFPNTRYRMTVDFIAGTPWTVIASAYCQMAFSAGGVSVTVSAQGSVTGSTVPALEGEVIQRSIEFRTFNVQPTSGTLLILITSTGAGTATVHIGNISIEPVDDVGY